VNSILETLGPDLAVRSRATAQAEAGFGGGKPADLPELSRRRDAAEPGRFSKTLPRDP